ncbi:hypothetical protein [Paraflavitalea speifideaquila]|uniref:tetratricopeptide repeat protein n=1 Tax=Paraflavitalea speifideaquila TaxID=3076558 RepID=UPI0028EFFD97|nr:hypothetical protein [Paraflavitalea speifideiaquila]
MVNILRKTLDSSSQFYTTIRNLKSFSKNASLYSPILRHAKQIGDFKIYEKVGSDYVYGYLEKEPNWGLTKKDNVQSVASLIIDYPNQFNKIRNFFFSNQRFIDSIYGEKLVTKVRDIFIRKTEIDPIVYSKEGFKEEQWQLINNNISREYDSLTADRLVLDSKIVYYEKIKSWDYHVHYFLMKFRKYGVDKSDWLADAALNNQLWSSVFLHSNNKLHLYEAVEIARQLVERNKGDFNYWDTYGNLLYKLGDKAKALSAMREAERLNRIIQN